MGEPNVATRARELLEPPLTANGLEVVDVVFTGGCLRLSIDRPGGIDIDTVSEATRTVSEMLDEHDLVAGKYTLEVSSPGVERPLRTPEHFQRFVGSDVTGRTVAGVGGERRFDGTIESADSEAVVIAGRRLSYNEIERARTRFVWPAPSAVKRAAS